MSSNGRSAVESQSNRSCSQRLIDERVVGWQGDVLAAAAADADEHLSIGAPVLPAHRRVDQPREREVGRTDRAADQTDVADGLRVVAGRFQDATDLVRNPQDDERPDDGARQIYRLELATSRLDLLPLRRQLR